MMIISQYNHNNDNANDDDNDENDDDAACDYDDNAGESDLPALT